MLPFQITKLIIKWWETAYFTFFFTSLNDPDGQLYVQLYLRFIKSSSLKHGIELVLSRVTILRVLRGDNRLEIMCFRTWLNIQQLLVYWVIIFSDFFL